MRKKKLKNQWRLYMNPHDFRGLVDAVRDRYAETYVEDNSDYAEAAIRLGCECGLRVSETVRIQLDDVRESTHPDVNMMFLRVRETKATSGDFEDGKYRSTFLPRATRECLEAVAETHDRAEDEPVIGRGKRSVQKYVKRAGKLAAAHMEERDFEALSSHDLRAYFATNLLVRHNLNPEVVKEIGGWQNYENLKPYLARPGDDVIAAEVRKASLAEGYRPEGPKVPEAEEPTPREQATIDKLTE